MDSICRTKYDCAQFRWIIQSKCGIQHLSLFLDLNILLAATQSKVNYFILVLCNYTQYNSAAYVYIYNIYIYDIQKFHPNAVSPLTLSCFWIPKVKGICWICNTPYACILSYMMYEGAQTVKLPISPVSLVLRSAKDANWTSNNIKSSLN